MFALDLDSEPRSANWFTIFPILRQKIMILWFFKLSSSLYKTCWWICKIFEKHVILECTPIDVSIQRFTSRQLNNSTAVSLKNFKKIIVSFWRRTGKMWNQFAVHCFGLNGRHFLSRPFTVFFAVEWKWFNMIILWYNNIEYFLICFTKEHVEDYQYIQLLPAYVDAISHATACALLKGQSHEIKVWFFWSQ